MLYKVEKITIYEGECGKKFIDGEVSFSSYRCANDYLFSQAKKHIKPEIAGFKHDFDVLWEDGSGFRGRLYCNHPTVRNNDLRVDREVCAHAAFFAGLENPRHLSVEEYIKFLDNESEIIIKRAVDLLEKYDLGDAYMERSKWFKDVRNIL